MCLLSQEGDGTTKTSTRQYRSSPLIVVHSLNTFSYHAERCYSTFSVGNLPTRPAIMHSTVTTGYKYCCLLRKSRGRTSCKRTLLEANHTAGVTRTCLTRHQKNAAMLAHSRLHARHRNYGVLALIHNTLIVQTSYCKLPRNTNTDCPSAPPMQRRHQNTHEPYGTRHSRTSTTGVVGTLVCLDA